MHTTPAPTPRITLSRFKKRSTMSPFSLGLQARERASLVCASVRQCPLTAITSASRSDHNLGVKRRDWLRKQLPAFLREYGRTSRRRGADPNDRHYDRELEQQVKRMDPQELDDLMRSDDE